MPPGPVTAPDSAGYLAFAPIHVLGYPLFLKIVGARGAMIVQPLVYASVLAYFGHETLRLTSSVLLASGVVLSAVLIPELQTYHYSVLTESLFMSGMLAGDRLRRWICARSVVGARLAHRAWSALTATVRQTGVALLPVRRSWS